MRLTNFVWDIQTATVSSGEAEFKVDSVNPSSRQIKDNVYPFRGDVKSPLHIFQGGTQIATTDCAYNLTGSFNNYSTGSSDLVLWAKMTPSWPTNAAVTSVTTLAYTGGTVTSTEEVAGSTFDTMTCSDSGNDHAYAQSDHGLLSFSSIGDEGTPTSTSDRPFSISLWLKIDSLTDDGPNGQGLFAKANDNEDYGVEYSAYISAVGVLSFRLDDTTAGGADFVIRGGPNYFDLATDYPHIAGRWTHFMFTYDGRGTSASPDAWKGMEIYIDGVNPGPGNFDGTTGGTYVGMQPKWGDNLEIGAKANGQSEVDGQIAEFAMWNGLLDAAQVKAVYDASYLGTQQSHLNFYVSGSINRTEIVNSNSTLKMTGSLSAIPEYAHCYKWGVLMVGDSEFEG